MTPSAATEGSQIRSYRIASMSIAEHAPTFVVLHGIGLSHRVYSGLGRGLSRAGNVVSFDLPGFGPTRRPNRRLTVEDHAAVIAEQLMRLGVTDATVVGHSMGAQFAIEVARKHPHLVHQVVLIGPVVDSAHRTLRAQAWGLLRNSPLEPPRTQLAVLFDYLRCGLPWFLIQAAAMRDYPTHERIHDVTQPVLVIRGEHDLIANSSWCRWLSRQVPSSRVVTIPKKRHNVAHSDTAAIAAAILDFADRSH